LAGDSKVQEGILLNKFLFLFPWLEVLRSGNLMLKNVSNASSINNILVLVHILNRKTTLYVTQKVFEQTLENQSVSIQLKL